jgi:beta-glucosidase/6-phospho-beta-glucosidase/beta-galactosidase
MSTDSFLDRIRRAKGDGDVPGDQFGGGAGRDGSGLPGGEMGETFVFATGIEGSYPTIGNGRVRRDLMAECGHYDRWKDDFALVKEMGLRTLRYGLPLHRVWLGDGRYDWDFADAALGELKRLEIRPILDLIHFGLPDWVGDFQNPDLPLLFQDYCAAVVDRYPWVRCFTPVNEAFVTARNSALDGLWNEQLRSDRAFVTAIKHLTAAGILGCHAIAARRNDCIIIQSESAEYTHRMSASVTPEDRMKDKTKFLALDLLYGCQPEADVLLYALDNGLTRQEYDWFMRGDPPGYQVLGIDYYGRNERVITPDGRTVEAPNALGWRQIAGEYWTRYRKPLMHTETNDFDPERAPDWLWKQWVNVLHIRGEGVPVLGFTWYSLTDQVDWDTQLAEQNGTVNHCGLYDLDRRPNPVARDFRLMLQEFGRISIMPHAEMLKVADSPASLKVDR